MLKELSFLHDLRAEEVGVVRVTAFPDGFVSVYAVQNDGDTLFYWSFCDDVAGLDTAQLISLLSDEDAFMNFILEHDTYGVSGDDLDDDEVLHNLCIDADAFIHYFGRRPKIG